MPSLHAMVSGRDTRPGEARKRGQDRPVAGLQGDGCGIQGASHASEGDDSGRKSRGRVREPHRVASRPTGRVFPAREVPPRLPSRRDPPRAHGAIRPETLESVRHRVHVRARSRRCLCPGCVAAHAPGPASASPCIRDTWQGKRRRRSVGRRLDGVGRRVACGPTSTSWGWRSRVYVAQGRPLDGLNEWIQDERTERARGTARGGPVEYGRGRLENAPGE